MQQPRHRQVQSEGISIHVAEAGAAGNPAVMFLHGWPENWAAFQQVMAGLSADAHVLAIDLPGIGGSEHPPCSNDKRTLARYVAGAIHGLRLTAVTLVGHDIGGQIVYSYLHAYPGELQRAVIMNVAIPGVDPWFDVKRNPHIWHFAFHAIPGLPEILVEGKQAAYFGFFYDATSARPGGVDEQARQNYVQAYSRPEALRVGFEWYRAFPQDEKDNLGTKDQPVDTPVLYLRGEREGGDLGSYVTGLRKSGLLNVRGHAIANSGHFAPDEQPGEVAWILREFMNLPV